MVDRLIKRTKVILNQDCPEFTEVAIGEIRRIKNQIYFVLSFGGNKEALIIGRDEWDKFIDLIINLDWDPEDTWIRPLRKDRKHMCRFD